ncbi:MAG: ABC transporter permease [Caldilineaceae bacterium]
MNKFLRTSFIGRLLHQPSGLIGLVLVLVYLLIALFAGKISPYSPLAQHPVDMLQAPNSHYWLGTDEFGRDILSRLMRGATNSLRVAIFAVVLAGGLGSALGIVAAYYGGWWDNVIMRVMDLLFAFPALLLALSIAAALGPGAINTILAIAVVYLPIFARVGRGSVLGIKELEYVDAARTVGASHSQIIWRHILPNALAPTIVQISLALSWAMLTEASLSFLGLGTLPPQPSWGSMLNDGRTLMELAPWLVLAPGLALLFGVLGFNLLGDGLRDALDPRLNVSK